jgi:CheY-like chemotaxis protein
MPSEPHRILIADDDPSLLDMLRMLFEEEKYEVVKARSVAGALALLREAPVDLVLTDAFGPPGDALSATAELRAACGDTPVVLLTAHIVPSEEAAEAGFAAVTLKPFDVDALLEQVRQLLS